MSAIDLGKGITAEICTITPADATQMLEHNKGNRALRTKHVKFLAQQMRDDLWQLTHEGIAFDKTGRLLDGQHRLQALIEVGKPLQMLVTRGWNESVFNVLDDGAPRKPNDRVAIYHTIDSKENKRAIGVISTIRTLYHCKKDRLTTAMIKQLWGIYRTEIIRSMLTAKKYTSPYYSATVEAAVVVSFHGKQQGMINRFINTLVHDAPGCIEAAEARLYLEDIYQNRKAGGGMPVPRLEIFRKIVQLADGSQEQDITAA